MSEREIKFRVWGKRYGMLYNNENQTVWAGGQEPSVNTSIGRLTDEFKLMQYTGLKDKIGKEIYEGDLLQVRLNKNLTTNLKVFYTSGRYMVDNPDMIIRYNLSEIVHEAIISGNIYENPELL